jgi:RNA ligase
MTNALYTTNENGDKTIKFRTKMGYDTDVAKKIQKFIDQHELKDNYLKFLSKWLDNGFTPIFEFVAPDNKIVVEYKKGELILLAIRDVKTGLYISYDDTVKESKDFGIPVVQNFEFGLNLLN